MEHSDPGLAAAPREPSARATPQPALHVVPPDARANERALRSSNPKSSPIPLSLRAAVTTVEWLGQLVVPGALLSLAGGEAQHALVVSALGLVLAVGRGALAGVCVERAHRRTWAQVAAALRRTSLLRMRASDGGDGALLLAEAVRESVLYEAIGVPHIIGRVLALGTLLAVALVMLPVQWVLLGGGVVAATLALGALLQRRLQRAQRVVWDGFANVVKQATLLTGAAIELRAHAREQWVADELSRGVASMARGERNASALSAMSGFVPATIALLALAAPVRAGAQWAIHMLGGAGLARLGVIGAAAAAVAIGLVRAVDLRVRSAPGRKALAVFLSRAEPASDSVVPGSAVPSLATATIAFDRASLTYPNASEATPHEFDHVWRSDSRGLVVTGDNGAGKSTLALMLLGLLEPTSGRITLDGKPICDFDAAEYRRRIVYVPQRPFVAEGASVGWHLRYLSGENLSPPRVRNALRRFGLWEKLEDHARRSGCDPEDVPLETLSGGEQKRLHLARAISQHAELIVLDEPEAGIDQDGRRMLREVCDELTVNARVLLIAHDEAIIPASFARVGCTRGAR